MIGGDMRVAITDSPERESTYAEITCDGEEWAIVSDEHGPLLLEVFPRESGGGWTLDLEETLRALHYAKYRLLGEAGEEAAARSYSEARR